MKNPLHKSVVRVRTVIMLAAVAAGGMAQAVVNTTVHSCEELLEAVSSLDSTGGTITMASPTGDYPVTYEMTAAVSVTGLGSYNTFTLRGATGKPDDVILDFSQVSGCGVYLQGHYYGTATAHSFTIQNATNRNASASKGGGLTIDEGFASNMVVRCCQARTPDGTTGTPYGGGINFSGNKGITMSVISNCSARAGYYDCGGGGVWVRNGGTLNHTLITNCFVYGGNKAYGGGFGGNVAYTFKNSRIVDNQNRHGTSEAFGGGVFVKGNSASSVTNCCFANNTCVGKGGAFYVAYTTSDNSFRDSTFEGNQSSGEGGAIAVQYADVKNCRFVNNISERNGGAISTVNRLKLENSFFKDNSGGQGGALFGRAKTVRNCVFDGNAATSTTAGGGGALWLGANGDTDAQVLANSVVEDCLFKSNVTATSSGDVQQGSAIGADWGNNAQTNMVIRNCYFKDNDGLGGAIAIKRLHNGTFEPTFENGYGLNIVNCTFDGTVSPGKQIITSHCASYTSGDSVFVRNCHFTGSPEYKIANDAWMSIYDQHPDHFQYCVADVGMSALTTAAACHNRFGTKIRNKGFNQDWMSDAKDFGDGTYTLTPEADYGVVIAFNNRRNRILGGTVDVGCFETKDPGLVVIFR